MSFGRKEGDSGMAKEVLFLVEEAVEGGYIARALGHSIFTEADTWDELREAVRDAVHCHFDPDEQPDLIRLHAVREEVMAACLCPSASCISVILPVDSLTQRANV
jgi:hypothetical protein